MSKIKKKSNVTIKKLISVVIPVYNVEKYVSECLESIVAQTYGLENMEIIVVDDCGVDSSISIVKKFLAIDNIQLRIIEHAENKGLGGARNSGLSAATGEYIFFIDSDDFIEPNALEAAIKILDEECVDAVFLRLFLFSDVKIDTFPVNPSRKLFSKSFKLLRHEYCQHPILAHATGTNKVYRKSALEKLKKFPEDIFYEDVPFYVEFLSTSCSIYISSDIRYCYRQRLISDDLSITTSALSKKKIFDHITVCEAANEFIQVHKDLKYMYDWFNMRSLAGMLKAGLTHSTLLTKSEKDEVFWRAKELFKDASPNSTLNHEISASSRSTIQKIKQNDSVEGFCQ